MEQKLVRAATVPTRERSASVAALVAAGAQMREPMALADEAGCIDLLCLSGHKFHGIKGAVVTNGDP